MASFGEFFLPKLQGFQEKSFAPPELITLSILPRNLNCFSFLILTKSLVCSSSAFTLGAKIFRQPLSSKEIATFSKNGEIIFLLRHQLFQTNMRKGFRHSIGFKNTVGRTKVHLQNFTFQTF